MCARSYGERVHMSEIDGTSHDEQLAGSGDSDNIYGYGGNDTIDGSAGNDEIHGSGKPVPTVDGAFIAGKASIAHITFLSESAGYQSTVGFYKIAADGSISDVGVAFANASETGSGGDLTPGGASFDIAMDAGEQFGMFILPDGYSSRHNRSILNNADMRFELRTSDDKPANVGDTGPLKLVAIDTHGKEYVLSGAYGSDTFHTIGSQGTGYALNPDGVQHSINTLEGNGDYVVGFEDQYGGGDSDFNDAVLQVSLTKVDDGSGSSGTSTHPDNDVLYGGDGNDTVFGGAGNDYISGGNDDDQLLGQSGDDTISGDAGNDRIFGGDGNDSLDGGAGDDTINAGKGDDSVTGGDGNDTVIASSGNDTVDGGAGNDHLEGNSGNDMVSGGIGDDGLWGCKGDDHLDGGDGNNTVVGNSGNDVLIGGDGNDVMSGGGDGDQISGDAGDDTIAAGKGSDTVDGGDGHDSIAGQSGNDLSVGRPWR